MLKNMYQLRRFVEGLHVLCICIKFVLWTVPRLWGNTRCTIYIYMTGHYWHLTWPDLTWPKGGSAGQGHDFSDPGFARTQCLVLFHTRFKPGAPQNVKYEIWIHIPHDRPKSVTKFAIGSSYEVQKQCHIILLHSKIPPTNQLLGALTLLDLMLSQLHCFSSHFAGVVNGIAC